MRTYNRTKLSGGFSPALMLLLGAILTAAIILGIKFLISGDSNDAQPQTSGQSDIFKDDSGSVRAPGYDPETRSERTSGDSLDMFQKANVGYAADESSATAEAEPAAKEPAKATPAAAPLKQAAKETKKPRQRTVIPRIQGIKSFGPAASDSQATPKGGAGMPDMAEIMKQAKQNQESGD